MNKEVEVTQDYVDMRLDRFIKKIEPGFVQSYIESSLRKGIIKVNGSKAKSNYRINVGDVVLIPNENKDRDSLPSRYKSDYTDEKTLEALRLAIIYQDENLAVINKPAGLATQGGTNVKQCLDSYLPLLFSENAKLVHRLDKDTSGLIMIAKSHQAAKELSEIIKNKELQKTYLCLVIGFVKKLKGEINLQLSDGFKVESSDDGKIAVTNYKVLQRNQDASLLEMKPVTGRKHQIRVSCLELGHPIIGDGKYGGSNSFIPRISNKLHLHAYKLTIPEFMGQKNLSFVAPVNNVFAASLKELGFSLEENKALHERAKKWAK